MAPKIALLLSTQFPNTHSSSLSHVTRLNLFVWTAADVASAILLPGFHRELSLTKAEIEEQQGSDLR